MTYVECVQIVQCTVRTEQKRIQRFKIKHNDDGHGQIMK